MKASLDAAISGVAVAQATLDEARENYDRGLALQERGVESRQDLTTQKANFVRAQADFQAAIAQRELAQANLDLTQADLEKACICSPVAGVVLERDADVGQIVAASLSAPTLFTVAEDLTEMELQVDVDEADIGRVQVGQKATFTVEAYDDRVFPAEIKQVRFASETVDGVVTYKAILMLDNPDLALRPGMTATADITVADVSDALVVPNAALRYAPPATEEPSSSGGGSGLVGMIMPSPPGGSSNGSQRSDGKSVWVLKDGIATEVPVEVGDTDGSVTVILSGDLAEGDAVITDQTDAN